MKRPMPITTSLKIKIFSYYLTIRGQDNVLMLGHGGPHRKFWNRTFYCEEGMHTDSWSDSGGDVVL